MSVAQAACKGALLLFMIACQNPRCDAQSVAASLPAPGTLATAAADEPGEPHTFTISGMVVSARDGSPVAGARLAAVSVQNLTRRSPRRLPQNGRAGRARGVTGGLNGRPGQTTAGQTRPRQTRPGQQTALRSFSGPDGEAEISTFADGRGRFSLVVPHAGNWQLTGSARGFLTEPYDAHQGFFAGVVLSDGAPGETLTFALKPRAGLEGFVRDETGDPIEHATVQAELLPSSSAVGSEPTLPTTVGFAMTDDRGHYQIASLDAGRYRIEVFATPWYSSDQGNGVGRDQFRGLPRDGNIGGDRTLDLVFPRTWYPGTPDESTAETVKLVAGERRTADVQMVAVPAAHLKLAPPVDTTSARPGDASTRRGGSLATSGVVIARVSESGFDYTPQVHLNGGSTESGALAPGIYRIQSGPNAYAEPTEKDDIREIEIRPGASGVQSLEAAHPLLHVMLALVGSAEGAHTRLMLVDTTTGRHFFSNAPNGEYERRDRANLEDAGDQQPPQAADAAPPDRLLFLPPGTYTVTTPDQTGAYVAGLSATGARVHGGTVTVQGAARLVVQIATGRAQISGTATLGGKPLEGALVELVPISLGQPGSLAVPYRDESNTDGSFEMVGIVPGRYILIALDHGWDVDWTDPVALAKYLEHGTPLELAPGSKLEETCVGQAP